jgi:hypothetical protein
MTLFVQHLLQVKPVDPVHDEHVLVAFGREEVATHHRKCRMRHQAHQHSAFREEAVAVFPDQRIDLQRYEPVMNMVESL